MDLEGFKRIYYIEWAHRIVGRGIGALFLIPMTYFWGRGYLQHKLKKTLVVLFAAGAL